MFLDNIVDADKKRKVAIEEGQKLINGLVGIKTNSDYPIQINLPNIGSPNTRAF